MKKRILRVTTILLSILICLGLTSCMMLSCMADKATEIKTDENNFFDDDALEERNIPDLPKIDTKGYYEYGDFYYSTHKYNFEAYLNDVYSYLKSLEFKYLAYVDEIIEGSMFGIELLSVNIGDELSDFEVTDKFPIFPGSDMQRDYWFVFGNELNEKGIISDAQFIKLGFSNQDITSTLSDNKITYNAYVSVQFSVFTYKFVFEDIYNDYLSENNTIE